MSQNTKVESMNTSKSRSKATIHVISRAIATKDLYSVSAEDLETVACFLENTSEEFLAEQGREKDGTEFSFLS